MPLLYWTDLGTRHIQQVRADGTGFATVLSGVGSANGLRAMAADSAGGQIYWVDTGANTIGRANLDGSSPTTLAISGMNGPTGLALDPWAGQIYWSEYNSGRIMRAPIAGGAAEVLVSGLNRPEGLALDLVAGRIYWAEAGANRVQRANLNGSSVQALFSLSTPTGVALDLEGQRLYVAQWGGTIQVAGLDGSNPQVLLSNLGNLEMLTLDASTATLYWANPGRQRIERAGLDGSGLATVVSGNGLNFPYGIALVSAATSGPGGFSSAQPGPGRYGTPYSHSFVPQDAVAPVSFAVTSGTLPPGLSLDGASGVLAGTPTAAGSYRDIVVTATDATGQTFVQRFSLTIATALLTITADNVSRTVGAPNPPLTVTYSGLVNGDTAAVLDTPPVVSTSATASSPIGTYPIAVSGASDANYAIQFVAGTLTVTAADGSIPNPMLYWTDLGSGRIERARSDGSERAVVLDGIGAPNGLHAIAVDPNAGKMFWVDRAANDIWRANLDGTEATQIVANALCCPAGIALDPGMGHIYWTAFDGGAILRANYDGTGREVLVSGLVWPEGITLDVNAGHMYWTESFGGRVQRANLDGSNVTRLLTLNMPTGIAIDPPNNSLYVVQFSGFLQRADLDGSNQEVLLSGLGYLEMLTIDPIGGRLYWANETPAVIQSSRFDGSDLRTVASGNGMILPYGIALISEYETNGFSSFLPRSGRYGAAYNHTFTLADAVAPLTFAVTAGTLPPGLALDVASGVLSGTPTAAGTYADLAVTATDATGQTFVQQFTLAIAKAALTITADDLSRPVAEANPPLTVTYTGFVNGDTDADLDTPAVVSTSATGDSPIGTYPITVSGASDANYAIQFVAGTLTVTAPDGSVPTPMVYWTDLGTGHIQRARADGTEFTTVLNGVGSPNGLRAILVDAAGGLIYWADAGANAIWRANLDGSNPTRLAISGINGPMGLALDVAAGQIYWTEFNAGRIQRAPIAGGAAEVLVSGLNRPEGLALDSTGGRMYWVESAANRVQRANLDGSSVQLLISLSTPTGVALDLVGGRMYVSQWGGAIQVANLDGSNQQVLLSNLGNLESLVIDSGSRQLYWTNPGTRSIQAAGLDGTGLRTVISGNGLNFPYGIALVPAV